MASYLFPFCPLEIVLNRNQELQKYTGWLHTVAWNMTTNALHDDLVQEGYIAMWRALGTYNPDKGSLDYWLKKHATDKMRSVVTGERMTTDQERKSTTGFITERGNETRKKIAEYLAAHPGATSTAVAKALGMSLATISYQRNKMGTVKTATGSIASTWSLDALMDPVKNESMGHSSRSHEFTPEELWYFDDLDGIEVAYHAGEILEALDVLTPAQRRYVVARFWGGKSSSELRAMFGYDPASLWRTAKPRLQDRLFYLRELVRT